jgi:hypothetical protein
MSRFKLAVAWVILHVGLPCVLMPYLRIRWFFQPGYRFYIVRTRWPWSWFPDDPVEP